MEDTSGTSLLEEFWGLADVDKRTRLSSVKNLTGIKSVVTNGSANQKYALRRLTRGLSSSRGAARQGFAVALTQILKMDDDLDLEAMLSQVDENTSTVEVNHDAEKRDKLLGRLFGYLSLIRSQRLAGHPDIVKAIVVQSLKVAEYKPWIEEISTEVVCEALLLLTSSTSLVSILEQVSPNLKRLFGSRSLDKLTPARVSLLCCLDSLTSNNNQARGILVENVGQMLPHGDGKANIGLLEDILTPLKASCVTFPRLHSLWPKLLQLVFSDGPNTFRMFWESVVVDGFLNEDTTTRSQKHCAFKLLLDSTELFVENDLAHEIPSVLLLPNFMACLVAESTKTHRPLYRFTKLVIDAFLELLMKRNVQHKTRAQIAELFISNGMNENKSLTRLVATSGGDDNETIIAELKLKCLTQLEAGKGDPWTVNLLYTATKDIKDPSQRCAQAIEVGKFLVSRGLFIDNRATYIVPQSFQDACVTHLNNLLNDLTTLEGDESLGEGVSEINLLVKKELASKKRKLIGEQSFSEAERVARRHAMDRLKKLKKSQESEISNTVSFLLNHVAVQALTLNVSESIELNVDVVELLDDLAICADRVLEGENADEEVVVLVDAMVALLGQPSQLLRNVVKSCLKLLTPQIGISALDVFLSALMEPIALSEEELQQQQSVPTLPDGISNDEGDEDEDIRESDADASNDDDAEMKDVSIQASNIAEILATNAPLFDSDSENEGNAGSDKALAMFLKSRLDSTQRKKVNKKLKTKLEAEKVSLKLRVLDAIQTFVEVSVQPELLSVLPYMLLTCAESAVKGKHSTNSNNLVNKVKLLVRHTFSRLKKIESIGKKAQVSLEGSECCMDAFQPSSGESPVLTLRQVVQASLTRVMVLAVEPRTNCQALAADVVGGLYKFASANNLLKGMDVASNFGDMIEKMVSLKYSTLSSAAFEAWFINTPSLINLVLSENLLSQNLEKARDAFNLTDLISLLNLALKFSKSVEKELDAEEVWNTIAGFLKIVNTCSEFGEDKRRLKRIQNAKFVRVLLQTYKSIAKKRNELPYLICSEEECYQLAKKQLGLACSNKNIDTSVLDSLASTYRSFYKEEPPRPVGGDEASSKKNNKKRKLEEAEDEESEGEQNAEELSKKSKKKGKKKKKKSKKSVE